MSTSNANWLALRQGEAAAQGDVPQLGADEFREFSFANAVRMLKSVNPRFFEGTVVADAARAV